MTTFHPFLQVALISPVAMVMMMWVMMRGHDSQAESGRPAGDVPQEPDAQVARPDTGF